MGGIALWLTTRFGAGIFTKILAGLLLAAIVALGTVMYLNSNLTSKNATLTGENKTLAAANAQLVVDLKAQIDETARVQKVANRADVVRTVVQTKYVEVVREVVKYRDNPDVKHVDLDPKWVCAYNAAAHLSAIAIAGQAIETQGAIENYQCTQESPVSDSDALEVATENNAKYAQLVIDYNELLERYNTPIPPPK